MTETPKGTRAADDFSFINSRMKEIEKEREDVQAARNKEEAEREKAAVTAVAVAVERTPVPDTYLGVVDYTTMVTNPGKNFGENTQLQCYAFAAGPSMAPQTGRTKFQRCYGSTAGGWLSVERYAK
jgi:hypothetical protein